MSTAIVSMDQLHVMATELVKSKLFGFKTEAEALSIMLIAQAEGRSPALAARDYHVIQGRPALKADAMLARFQQEGGVIEWTCYTDSKVSGKFSHPKSCPVPVEVTWTLDMAKRIGLANRDNWRNYPRAMLRSRVVSEGVRTTYPGIAVGIYTVEEVHDMRAEKDITPAGGAGDTLTEDQRVKISDLADRVREWLLSGSLGDAFAEIDNAGLDAEEYIFLWTHFDAKTRRQLKEEGDRVKIRNRGMIESDLISDAQRKRLEARISELELKRDEVKDEVMERFGKRHFSELTKSEYEELDSWLEQSAVPINQPIGEGSKATGEPPADKAGAVAITAEQAAHIETLALDNKISAKALAKAAGAEFVTKIPANEYQKTLDRITAMVERRGQV